MPSFPSPALRQKLSWLGIPESEHAHQSLLSMLPANTAGISDVNSVAEVLIYLIGKHIIHIPSPSAASLIQDISYGGHICQFYRTSAELLALLVPFFKQGIGKNHRGIWIVSTPLTIEVATTALENAGLKKELEKRAIQLYWANDWYTKNGHIKNHHEIMAAWKEKEREALDDGFNGLRITGDTRFVVTEKDWESLMQYEAKVHGVINNSRIMAICSYTFNQSGDMRFGELLNSHNEVAVHAGRAWHRIQATDAGAAEKLLKDIRKSDQDIGGRKLPGLDSNQQPSR